MGDAYADDSDLAEIKSTLKELAQDFKAHGKGLAEIKVTLAKLDAKLDGKLTGVEGHLAGIVHRFASLPTTWTMLGIVFTTWALGSGILIFAMNFMKR